MINYIKSIFRKHKYELVKVDVNTGKDYKCYTCGKELKGVHIKMNAKGLRGCKGGRR